MNKLLVTTVIAASFGLLGNANAGQIVVTEGSGPFTQTVTVNASTTNPGLSLLNLGTNSTPGYHSNAPIAYSGGTITFSPDTNPPPAGVYSGTTSNAKSPFGSTSTQNYLVAQPKDPVNITFGSTQSSFSLLWGTVDPSNVVSLDLYFGNTLLDTISVSGNDVASAAGISPANGTTSAYVTISDFDSILGDVPFNRVVLTTGQIAFEFDPAVQSTPEPASMALVGMGLAGVGLARRRRAKTA